MTSYLTPANEDAESVDFVLRNYPDDDALLHSDKYPKALSFSPDIIPLYGTMADPSTLVDDASWRGFSGMPIVGGHVNNVHIRGYGAGGPYVAYLRAIPSELILWPQVWSDANPVSSGPVVIQARKDKGRYASDGPVHFRPSHTSGQSHSLIAHVFRHNSLKKTEEQMDAVNHSFSVEDFLKFQAEDKEFTFYNVVVADPTLQHITVNTRLRTFQKGIDIFFRLKAHEGTRVPEKLDVSLVDDRGNISIYRTKLTTFSNRIFKLRAYYDGILTFNLFAPPNQALFEPYSGFSLQVYTKNSMLLGALNIIFDHQSTRNLRFANYCEKEPKGCNCDYGVHHRLGRGGGGLEPDCVPIPSMNPAAAGWWFRANMNDTNNFPRAGPVGCSPDIQPVGTDAPKASIWNDLLNPSIDYSSANSIQLVRGNTNYVFVRGYSSSIDIDVQSRVFAFDGSVSPHPSHYEKQSITGVVWGDTEVTVAQRSISATNNNQFYIFGTPFTVDIPNDPGNHYCFVAEVRQKPKCSLVYPTWPSEREEDFATLSDYANWILTCPLICQRNIDWVFCEPGGEFWEWQCKVKLVIPECSSYSTFWSVILECYSPIIPNGSSWRLTCTDDMIFSEYTCFLKRQNRVLDIDSLGIAGCHFTGAPPGYSMDLTLLVTWYDGHRKIPPPCVKLRLGMTDAVTNLSPIKHMAVDPPRGSEYWPFFVTKNYPYLGDEVHPSPLPSFKSVGIGNTWPYPGVPNLVFGQVTLIAKTD